MILCPILYPNITVKRRKAAVTIEHHACSGFLRLTSACHSTKQLS